MYSQLIFTINGKEIVFKLHEILQIAISLVNEKKWKLMLKEEADQLSSIPENTVILDGDHASVYQGGHYICNNYGAPCQFEVEQPLLAARSSASSNDELILTNEKIIQSILEHPRLKKAPKITDPAIHELTLSLVKEPSFIFANDLKFLRPLLFIPPMANQITSLPKWLYLSQYYRENYLKHPLTGWWVEIAGRLLLIKNTKDYGYYLSDHGCLKDLVSALEEIVFDLPWTNPEFVLLLNEAKRSIATDSQNPDDLQKKQDELLQSFIKEQPEVIQKFNSSLSHEKIQKDQQELAERWEKNPSLAGEYWDSSIEAMTYIVEILVRRFLTIKRTPYHPDSPFYHSKDSTDDELGKDFHLSLHELLEDEPERVDEMVKTIVLASLAKDINAGKHESLFRPMFSYGDKDKGAPYHQFAASAVKYMADKQLCDQQLAQTMREIITGKSVDDDELGFLINLVSAWFIPEAARNPLSILTGIMMIDMIENNISLIENDVNIYTLQYALTHPNNGEPKKEIVDLCKNKTTPWKIGGTHPMAHQGSESQVSLDKTGRMTQLSVVRQKEGRLLLDWLFVHLSKYLANIPGHDIIIKIDKSSDVPIESKNLQYSEIAFNKKTANKLDKGGKIDKEALLLKQNIQWYLLEPLLELRLNFGSNLFTNGLQFFEGILNKFKEATAGNKHFNQKIRYAVHLRIPHDEEKLSYYLYDLMHAHEKEYMTDDSELIKLSQYSKEKYIEAIHNTDMGKQLSNLSLAIGNAPGRGCFFSAIRDQLQIRTGKKYTIEDLRFGAASYVIEHPQEFGPVITALSFINAEDYLERLFENKEWSNNLIITALAHVFNIKLFIIQNDNNIYSVGNDNDTAVYLGYFKSSHYISLYGTPSENIIENQAKKISWEIDPNIFKSKKSENIVSNLASEELTSTPLAKLEVNPENSLSNFSKSASLNQSKIYSDNSKQTLFGKSIQSPDIEIVEQDFFNDFEDDFNDSDSDTISQIS